MKTINKRKYENISVGDEIKTYKGKDNDTSRKETISRWSERTSTLVKIDRYTKLNTYYIPKGLNKHFNRHELLLIDQFIMRIRKRYHISQIIPLVLKITQTLLITSNAEYLVLVKSY
jgi:hypothetical protein